MNICSVLIVDDNEADRYLLRRQITEAGITDQIFEADDGKAAIDFLEDYDQKKKEHPEKFPPILIFLDINMPLMNGFEFLERFSKLRQSEFDYNSTVLMMFTSSEREEDRQKAFDHDFVKGFITKMPTTPEELAKQVRQAFAS